MKARILPLAFIAALVLAFGAVAAACGSGGSSAGGGEPLTLEEYFLELEAIVNQAEERYLEVIEESRELSSADVEQRIDEFLDVPSGNLSQSQEILESFDELNAPEQARDAHKAFVEAGGDILTAYESFFDRLEELESTAEPTELLVDLLQELFERESFVDAGERLQQACFDLEEIASENDIEVDLSCEG